VPAGIRKNAQNDEFKHQSEQSKTGTELLRHLLDSQRNELDELQEVDVKSKETRGVIDQGEFNITEQ